MPDNTIILLGVNGNTSIELIRVPVFRDSVYISGFLCTTEAEYADAIAEVVGMSDTRRTRVAASARDTSDRFSDQAFKAQFVQALRKVIPRGH